LLANTLVAWLLYSDNENCQEIIDKAECEEENAMGGIYHHDNNICNWNESEKTCEYSNLSDVISVRYVIQLTIVVSAIASVVYECVKWECGRILECNQRFWTLQTVFPEDNGG
jgi:hypothetical protein